MTQEYPTNCSLCSEPATDLEYGIYECGCPRTERRAAVERWQRWQRNRVEFTRSLPPRYRRYAEQSVPAAVAGSRAGIAAAALQPSENLYLWGLPGGGKTHLAVQAVLRMMEAHDLTGLYVGEEDYFERVFAEFHGGPPAPSLKRPGVLLYDDFGKQKGSDFTFQKIYGMLEGRWAGLKTFIITANLEPIDVVDNVTQQEMQAKSVLSRIHSGEVIEVTRARDHRVLGGAK